MGSFGEALRDAREARGLSLDDVASTTRVARRHLAALERGDLDALPAGPFAKGYIEAYGKAVGIDPRPVIEAYRAEARRKSSATPGGQDRMLDELAQIVNRRSGAAEPRRPVAKGRLGIVFGSCAVALLATFGWLALRDDTGHDAPAAAPSPTAAARAKSAPAPSPAGHATPAPSPRRPNPDIAVSDSGLGTGVENHRLVGAAEEFREGREVVFLTRVVGGDPGDVIYHVWLHEDRGVARIPLTIGGAVWRTFSRRPLPPGARGHWTVEARGLDGRLLARQQFVCMAAER